MSGYNRSTALRVRRSLQRPIVVTIQRNLVVVNPQVIRYHLCMNAAGKTIKINWISVLNEQTEWSSLSDAEKWFAEALQRNANPTQAALEQFWDSLNLIRAVVYDLHFGHTLDLEPINNRLDGARFAFQSVSIGALPLFRATIEHENDSALLSSVGSTLLLEFGQSLSGHLSGEESFDVMRCEGLYRDPKLGRLSAAPDVDDAREIAWRREVEVIVEQGLDASVEILRCADLFVSASRSRFCSNACRTNTFQIVKQLRNPVYLADKQRRYRASKK